MFQKEEQRLWGRAMGGWGWDPNWVLEGLDVSKAAGKYVKVKVGPDWRASSMDKETLELKCLGGMHWSKFLSW